MEIEKFQSLYNDFDSILEFQIIELAVLLWEYLFKQEMGIA